ncbi:hypothetical protein JCM5353_006936 [Sporobolomyces roseus]
MHSFLLSPSSLPTFLLRVILSVQYSTPRKSHPNRSLRFFLTLWAISNLTLFAIDLVWGSRGIKGSGWTQGGIIVDFIGQVTKVGRKHLLGLDALIALSQALTIIISFSITLPSDLDASTSTSNGGEAAEIGGEGASGEAARDYFGLLGLHENSFIEEEEGEDELDRMGYTEYELGEEEERIQEIPQRRRRRRRRKSGNQYEGLGMQDDRGEDDSDDYVELDRYGRAHLFLFLARNVDKAVKLNFSSLSDEPSTSKLLPSSSTRERIVVPPIAKLRLRHVWNEVKWNTRRAKESREVFDLTREEEGIGQSTRASGAVI